jgi:hypothetical protein
MLVLTEVRGVGALALGLGGPAVTARSARSAQSVIMRRHGGM